MANDTKEEFWGITLSEDTKEFVWDPTTDSEADIEHKLQISTACLGSKAKKDERNLVEVSTQDDNGKSISCPIVSLRIGNNECSHIDLGFHNTTKFTLKEGNGPLSLCGVHLQALPLDFDEDESSDDEDIPDLIPEPNTITTQKTNTKKEEPKKESAAVKRPAPETKNVEQPAKKKKAEVVIESEDEEEDSEEDHSEEEDEQEESLLDNEAEEVTDEESEGDDEPEEGDDVESDEDEQMESDEDDEEDDDEDDEEEEEEKPVKKQEKKVNGHATPSAKKQQTTKDKKTPVAKAQPAKDNKKTPKKDTQTPGKGGAKKTPKELKALLLKSPNLPKKFDKFTNFMKNNYKVTDAKKQKDIWDYVQKNKK